MVTLVRPSREPHRPPGRTRVLLRAMSAALAAAVSEYSASSTSSSDLSSSAASMDVSHDPDNANDPSKDGSISHSAKGAHSSAALSSTHECGQPDTGASDTPATSSDTDDYDHQEQERDRGEGFVLDQEQDDDEDESKLSAWTRWYLSKDLEWRRRSRQQLQARTDARYGRSAAEEQETRRRAEAKRAFDAWLALKAEDDTLRRSRERHERAEAEHERAKAQRRSREISERKCGEWAARKQEQGALSKEKQISAAGGDSAEKALANKRAFTAWLSCKKSIAPMEKFHVKCVDGQLLALWQ